MKWDWWNGKVQLHLEIFQVLVMEWLWQPTRCVRKEQVKRMSWIWIVILGRPKDQVTWEMKAECCQDQLLNIWCVDTFLELLTWWARDMLSLLTLAYLFMNSLFLDFMSVMLRPSWDIDTGLPFRPWMTFHVFWLSEFDNASWRRSFQLSALTSLIALGLHGRYWSTPVCFDILSIGGNFEYGFSLAGVESSKVWIYC